MKKSKISQNFAIKLEREPISQEDEIRLGYTDNDLKMLNHLFQYKLHPSINKITSRWPPKKGGTPSWREKEQNTLNDYSQWKWSKIANLDKPRGSGKRNHHISIHSIIPKAHKELESMELDDTDLIYSLYISKLARLYGFININDHTLYLIWYDPKHVICPSKKK